MARRGSQHRHSLQTSKYKKHERANTDTAERDKSATNWKAHWSAVTRRQCTAEQVQHQVCCECEACQRSLRPFSGGAMPAASSASSCVCGGGCVVSARSLESDSERFHANRCGCVSRRDQHTRASTLWNPRNAVRLRCTHCFL